MNPKVILFSATSLDGKTSGFTVDMNLFYTLARSWCEDASLVGCDTLLNAPDEIPNDDGSEAPSPTPRPDDARPVLVVPDSLGRLKSWHFWRAQPYWKDFISLCTERTPSGHIDYLKRKGIKIIQAGKVHVDLAEAMGILYHKWNIKVVRVDSGGRLNGVMLKAGLVDKIHLLVHPVLAGGVNPRTVFMDAIPGMDGGISLRFLDATVQDHGVLLISYAVEG